MESFVWDEHFVTNLDDVDRQHQRLVELINAFGAIVTHPGGVDLGRVGEVFEELVAFARHHFAEEASIMAAAPLDPRYVEQHLAEHASFLLEVARLRAAITPGATDQARALLSFLINWLAYHILGTDQGMAKQVAAVRAGRSPAEALREHAGPGSVEPLLHALNGLFRQVSERNRELMRLNQTLEARVEARTRELAAANRQLEEVAMTDALTGLPNRRRAMHRLEAAWRESVAANLPLSCMLIDADGFKEVNDTWGHDAGDEVLRRLARELRYASRTDDLVCRLGGDEFLVICPRTALPGAKVLADKLCDEVSTLRVEAGGGVWRGSVSVGVAERTRDMSTVEALIKAADRGVYRAKRGGRGQAAIAA